MLYYWLAALGYLVAGVSEIAARFPSAVAGLVLVLTTYACARRWYDEATGLLAGAITATSFGYVAVARQALPDLLLAVSSPWLPGPPSSPSWPPDRSGPIRAAGGGYSSRAQRLRAAF